MQGLQERVERAAARNPGKRTLVEIERVIHAPKLTQRAGSAKAARGGRTRRAYRYSIRPGAGPADLR